MSLHNIFCEVAYVSVNVIEINNNIEVNSFSIFSGKFATQRPCSNILCFKDVGKGYERSLV